MGTMLSEEVVTHASFDLEDVSSWMTGANVKSSA